MSLDILDNLVNKRICVHTSSGKSFTGTLADYTAATSPINYITLTNEYSTSVEVMRIFVAHVIAAVEVIDREDP